MRRMWSALRRGMNRVRAATGFSVVEVMVAVAIFSFAVMALASSSGLIAKQMKIARRDMRLAFATQQKMEELLSYGYDGVTAGTDTIDQFAMAWTVLGTNPKMIVLVTRFQTPTGGTRADTIITQVAKP